MRTFYLAILVIFLVDNSAFAGNDSKSKNSVQHSKKTSFTENKQWEQRLSDRLRSGNDLRMVSPVSGMNYDGKDIEFSWSNGKPQKMFLGLLNNENKEVFYKEVSNTGTILPAGELLKPGLYYWVLESEEDILTLGKFYYKKGK